MSAQATPGPWLVGGVRYHRDFRVCQNVMADDEFVAAVGADGPWDIAANARLIAAAPELLEACKQFMPKGVAIGNGNVPDDLIIPLDVTIGELRKLEAAIAKAEGRS